MTIMYSRGNPNASAGNIILSTAELSTLDPLIRSKTLLRFSRLNTTVSTEAAEKKATVDATAILSDAVFNRKEITDPSSMRPPILTFRYLFSHRVCSLSLVVMSSPINRKAFITVTPGPNWATDRFADTIATR
jgi:hypothetical protein